MRRHALTIWRGLLDGIRSPWPWMVIGATVASVLLVWLYGLIGDAVWLPVAVGGVVYLDVRVTAAAEKAHTDLVAELDHLRRDLTAAEAPSVSDPKYGPLTDAERAEVIRRWEATLAMRHQGLGRG